MATCSVDQCDKPTRSGRASLCAMHYHRQYRHGSTETVARGEGTPSVSHGRRYRTAYRPNHPLAFKHGNVYVHRATLYDHIGDGPHPCHWCGQSVNWLPKGSPDMLMVDHLNGIGDDNRIENLVPACGPCNTARASQARAAALRSAGWWASHDTVANLRQGGRRPTVESVSDLT